ncbi:uncharacterized protein METZ01_LOCUS232455 [marine metagenome]|uniref:Uncharacterized protein n=1 Tax=marine metagenome TaxID=408172 RepID=A0A382GZI3_9ZZZZ
MLFNLNDNVFFVSPNLIRIQQTCFKSNHHPPPYTVPESS